MADNEKALFVELMMELVYLVLGLEFVGKTFSQNDFSSSEQEMAFDVIIESGIATKGGTSFKIDKTDEECRNYLKENASIGRFSLNQIIPIYDAATGVDNSYANWPNTIEPFRLPSLYKKVFSHFLTSGYAIQLDETRFQWASKYINLYRLGYDPVNDDLIKTAHIMPIPDDEIGVKLRRCWVDQTFG